MITYVADTRGSSLFVTKRDHGVDAHRAPRGNVGGEQGDEEDQDWNGSKNQRVDGLHVVKQRGHQAGESKRGEKADEDTDSCEKGYIVAALVRKIFYERKRATWR